jgi:DNA gyrase/topoisomerase IV subunit A
MSDVDEPPSEEQQASVRLSVLEALFLAVQRRGEVLNVIAEARDPEEARRSVAELLDIPADTAAAQAVIDLRIRSFSQSEIARLESERDRLRGRLDQGL